MTYKTSKMGKLPVLVPGIGKFDSNYELAYNFKDNTGIINSPLNPSNFFETENFDVEKLLFNCYRKIEFNFSLKKSEISKGPILHV
jgi:hypothetical protein